jgi:hypothetical protein
MHVIYIIKHEIVIPHSNVGPTMGLNGNVTVWYQSVTATVRKGVTVWYQSQGFDVEPRWAKVEWSLDQEFEEELCLEDQFQTFECS